MIDTSSIHKAISVAKRRLKLQNALNAMCSASIALSVLSLCIVTAARLGLLQETLAKLSLWTCLALFFFSGMLAYCKKFSDNFVATKIDRYSNLSDRLASACAFEKNLATNQDLDTDTMAMMFLAIEDANEFVDKADPKGATTFRLPNNFKAAIGFTLAAALVAGIKLDTRPIVTQINPKEAHIGDIIVIEGKQFLGPSGPEYTWIALSPKKEKHQNETIIGVLSNVRFEVSAQKITFVLPPLETGGYSLSVHVASQQSRPIDFIILHVNDPGSKAPAQKKPVEMEEDDIEYIRELISEMRETAEATDDKALEELAKELETLLKEVEDGKVTKKKLLETLTKSEEKYMEGSEEAVDETVSDLKKAGKELKKDKLTKELGKALEKGDLDNAQKELENLAQKLDDNKLSDTEQHKIGKAMEQAAKRMEEAEKKRTKRFDTRVSKRKKSIRKLEKQKQEATTEKKRKDLARRLEREKRNLKRLQRNQEEKKKQNSKRQLKQLRRKMSEAAKELQRKKQKQNRQRSRRQVSKSMRDMARKTGKVSQDRRKLANRPKVATQMSDLKEALRRAKRKGSKGAKNRFGRNKRKRDFGSRSRGGQGQKGAWKPGQGNGNGNGNGNGKGYGDSHDPNVLGKPTQLSGKTKDESLQGIRGKGPSTRETILTAANKGFASKSYKDIYIKYKTIIEEGIKAEKVPSGYKHYVKRYFHEIRPK